MTPQGTPRFSHGSPQALRNLHFPVLAFRTSMPSATPVEQQRIPRQASREPMRCDAQRKLYSNQTARRRKSAGQKPNVASRPATSKPNHTLCLSLVWQRTRRDSAMTHGRGISSPRPCRRKPVAILMHSGLFETSRGPITLEVGPAAQAARTSRPPIREAVGPLCRGCLHMVGGPSHRWCLQSITVANYAMFGR
jgi:hypothetical protein